MLRRIARSHIKVADATTAQLDQLGPLRLLAGKWSTSGGTGWNMIALPFHGGPNSFRLLMNRYNETLDFTSFGGAVLNRGIAGTSEHDQTVFALEYDQDIVQVNSVDIPSSPLNPTPGEGIHHETGMWLFMSDATEGGVNIARSSTIPHGDSVLALGSARVHDGPPQIPEISGKPIGKFNFGYADIYDNVLFDGLFNPISPNELLQRANSGVTVVRTTEITVDTKVATGGIHNIPFVTSQANAADMKSTFWIQELATKDKFGNPNLRLQYSQVVMLEFFKDLDGNLIRWPHVSINTLDKVVE